MGKSDISSATPGTAAPRIFVPDELSSVGEIRLPERAVRHIAALRLRPNDEIALFNGKGGQYRAVLNTLKKDYSSARILEYQAVERESPLNVTLVQCLSAGDRMDVTLQKATELGVAAIVPLASERSVVRLSAERAGRRLEHWRNVVIAACEQCGRNRIPEVQPVSDLLPWLAQPHSGLRVLLDPDTDAGTASLPPQPPQELALLVGAEGGFAPHEREAAHRAGFLPLRLGPRILRTETAPMAALAVLQALWGDLK